MKCEVRVRESQSLKAVTETAGKGSAGQLALPNPEIIRTKSIGLYCRNTQQRGEVVKRERESERE